MLVHNYVWQHPVSRTASKAVVGAPLLELKAVRLGEADRIKVEAGLGIVEERPGLKIDVVPTWKSLSVEGPLGQAVEALDLLVKRGFYVDRSVFRRVLKRCIAQKDLGVGKRVHGLALRCGYESDAFLANHIIWMYTSHGRLEDAMQVFGRIPAPDTFLWATIISACVKHTQPMEAIGLYRKMRQSHTQPNGYVFVAVLKACALAGDLASGKEVHSDFLQSAVDLDLFIGNCLVNMYSKCGSLEDAKKVFDGLPSRNVVTWTAMIAGYVEHGIGEAALALFARMEEEGTASADRVTFMCLLKACGSTGALDKGKYLHFQIQERGLEGDVSVGNCLLDMYAKCGSLDDARKVFENLPKRDVVSWTAMIAGYAQHGLGQEALALYASMQRQGMTPANHVTFVCLLQACASVGALHHGEQLHAQLQKRGLEADVVVGSCLVDMYAKCGRLMVARRVFDKLPTKTVVTWNALLSGCSQHGSGQIAMQWFQEMQQQGVKPNDVTFNCLLVACSHEGLVIQGHRYFNEMVQDYYIAPDLHHHNCMVDLLARSGQLDEAETMLRTMPIDADVVGWTALLTACKYHRDIERAERCFTHLVQLQPGKATAYVLLASVYANACRWSDVARIEGLRKSAGAKKKPAKAYIEVKDKVHEFTVGEERADIQSKLTTTNGRLKEGSHVPHTELVLKAVSDSRKEDALCGHAEKLALVYGLLNTVDGTPLLVTKNLRMCNDCHSATKIMSRLEKRQITVRDAHRVHCFVDGTCSCGDRP